MNVPAIKNDESGSDSSLTEARTIFSTIIAENISTAAWAWLSEAAAKVNDAQGLNTVFTQVPRKTGKALLIIEGSRTAPLQTILPGLSSGEWTIDRLCRIFLLLQVNATPQDSYVNKVEGLFTGSELNEQVALYSALPLLAYPDYWTLRCAEGIRSNVADVLESIMYDNPYPARCLEQKAWNQMVLKAFFTEKKQNALSGLTTGRILYSLLYSWIMRTKDGQHTALSILCSGGA